MMSCVIVIALTMSGCIANTGNRPSASPEASPSSTALPLQPIYIIGIVNDQNGVPIPDARIAIWQGGQLVPIAGNPGYTGDGSNGVKGSFNFTVNGTGRYQITAEMPGYNGTIDRTFNNSTSILVTIPGYTLNTVTPAPVQGALAPNLPKFSVTRTGPNSVQVHLDSFGRATSVRGFYVETPALGQQEVRAIDQPLSEDETMLITDPNLTGVVSFRAFSWVNGSYTEVVNTTI